MRTEIDLSNPEERLYPGMYAEVSLEMNRRPDALTVPATAVGSDSVGNFVYTLTDNRITRLAINIGLTDSGRIEVTGGLSEETPVVTTIQGAPPPGTAVRPPMLTGGDDTKAIKCPAREALTELDCSAVRPGRDFRGARRPPGLPVGGGSIAVAQRAVNGWASVA